MDSVTENRPTRSLYIGNLNSGVTEVTIFEKFSTIGPVNFVHVCRDDSNKSLGYAYVTFAFIEHAQKAMETMNFDRVKDQNIRLLWTRSVPSYSHYFPKNVKKSVHKNDTIEMLTLVQSILSSNDMENDDSGDSDILLSPTKQAQSNIIVRNNLNTLKEKIISNFKASHLKNKFSLPSRIKETRNLVEEEGVHYCSLEKSNRNSACSTQNWKDHKPLNMSITHPNICKSAGPNEIKDLSNSKLPNQINRSITLRNINGVEVNENKMNGIRFVPHRLREHGSESEHSFRNVYVKNFGDKMNTEDLTDLFVEYGPLSNCQVMLDDDGNSRGFGFVSYERPQDAKRAVEALNGKLLRNGRQLYVSRAQKKAERLYELKKNFEKRKVERQYQGTNLYVKNLEDSVDDNQLRDIFSKFGKITSAKVMSQGNCSKGFGFVCFSTPKEATRAVTEMNGTIIGTKPLYVALAQRKEDRQAHLASQCIQLLANLRKKEKEVTNTNEEEPIDEEYTPEPATFEELILSEPAQPDEDIPQTCVSPTTPNYSEYVETPKERYNQRDHSKETYQLDHLPHHSQQMPGHMKRKIGPYSSGPSRDVIRHSGMCTSPMSMWPPRPNIYHRPVPLPVQVRSRPAFSDRYHRPIGMDQRLASFNPHGYHYNQPHLKQYGLGRGMIPRPYAKSYAHPNLR